jgi:hypothetical protein
MVMPIQPDHVTAAALNHPDEAARPHAVEVLVHDDGSLSGTPATRDVQRMREMHVDRRNHGRPPLSRLDIARAP